MAPDVLLQEGIWGNRKEGITTHRQNNYPTKTATIVWNDVFDLVQKLVNILYIVQESIETTNFSVNQNMHFSINQWHHTRIQDIGFENKEDFHNRKHHNIWISPILLCPMKHKTEDKSFCFKTGLIWRWGYTWLNNHD